MILVTCLQVVGYVMKLLMRQRGRQKGCTGTPAVTPRTERVNALIIDHLVNINNDATFPRMPIFQKVTNTY